MISLNEAEMGENPRGGRFQEGRFGSRPAMQPAPAGRDRSQETGNRLAEAVAPGRRGSSHLRGAGAR